MYETWKEIPGFEGLYEISNLGRIKSFRKSKKSGFKDEYFLKRCLANNGYYQVTLYGNRERKKFQVHRLVASCFIPNPDNLPQINHKDENPLNNCADNLEWCTAAYNNSYGTARLRGMITKGKMVDQFLPSGQFIARYICSSIAEKITGTPKQSIRECCRGEAESAHGFIWHYAE